MKSKLILKTLLALLTSVAISGCKTTEPLYYYGGYQESVYEYFKGDSIALGEQINALEEIIALAQGEGKPVSPGLHAHLGMLYFENGNAEQGYIHFEQEKYLFPESTSYLDFLLKSNTKESL